MIGAATAAILPRAYQPLMTCATREPYKRTMSIDRSRSDAVVIGGSIAGLLAARVLAEAFETVTILERDVLPCGPMPRPGAPQAAHQHVLLLRGLGILEALFPGLTAELVERGAPRVDM